MELDIWAGDWGIPSVNPKCLSIMAYTKFSRAPVDVRTTNNPWRSPDGTLPVLRHDGQVMTKLSDMFSHLRAQNFGCEFELSAVESADLIAFISMVERKLAPAVKHLLWINAKNYSEVIRPWYGRAVKLPLSLYYPNRYKDDAETEVYSSHPNLSEEDACTKIYKDARECMNYLSSKLSNSDYFFGTNPTALDAIVFGHLAPLLKAPIATNSLSGHLKAIDNLQAFVRRINFRFFTKEIETLTAEHNKSMNDSKLDSEEFPNKRRNIVLSAIFALSAMISYAFLSGLVNIEISHEDDDELDDSADD